jgi:hypothetical protein
VLGAGWLMGVAALLVVATVVWSVSFGRTRVADAPVLSAEQWVRETARAHDVVLVDLAVWPDLSRSSGAAVGWYAAPSVGTSGVPSSASWSRADFVVATPLLQRHAGGAAAAVLRRSVPVAAFGSGDSAIEVRAVRRAAPAPSPSPPSAAELRAAEARKQTGAELARNPHLILTASGRAELRAGDVDSRVAIVLAQLLATQRVTVADFPAVKSDHGGPRRRVLISAVDGHPVPEDKARSADLIRYLSGLRGDFATATIEAGDAGVLATFAPDPTFVPPS